MRKSSKIKGPKKKKFLKKEKEEQQNSKESALPTEKPLPN